MLGLDREDRSVPLFALHSTMVNLKIIIIIERRIHNITTLTIEVGGYRDLRFMFLSQKQLILLMMMMFLNTPVV